MMGLPNRERILLNDRKLSGILMAYALKPRGIRHQKYDMLL